MSSFSTTRPGGNITLSINHTSNTTGGFLSITKNGTSNDLIIKAPDNITTTQTYTLPTSGGTAGNVLTTDNNGNLSFTSASGITNGTNISTEQNLFDSVSGGDTFLFHNISADPTIPSITVTNTSDMVLFALDESQLLYNQLSSNGQLLTHNGSNYTALPAGTANYVLTATSDSVQWSNLIDSQTQPFAVGANGGSNISATGGGATIIYETIGNNSIIYGPNTGVWSKISIYALSWSGPDVTNYIFQMTFRGITGTVDVTGVGNTITYELINATNTGLTTGVNVLETNTAVLTDANEDLEFPIHWVGTPASSSHVHFGMRFSLATAGTFTFNSVSGGLFVHMVAYPKV